MDQNLDLSQVGTNTSQINPNLYQGNLLSPQQQMYQMQQAQNLMTPQRANSPTQGIADAINAYVGGRMMNQLGGGQGGQGWGSGNNTNSSNTPMAINNGGQGPTNLGSVMSGLFPGLANMGQGIQNTAQGLSSMVSGLGSDLNSIGSGISSALGGPNIPTS